MNHLRTKTRTARKIVLAATLFVTVLLASSVNSLASTPSELTVKSSVNNKASYTLTAAPGEENVINAGEWITELGTYLVFQDSSGITRASSAIRAGCIVVRSPGIVGCKVKEVPDMNSIKVKASDQDDRISGLSYKRDFTTLKSVTFEGEEGNDRIGAFGMQSSRAIRVSTPDVKVYGGPDNDYLEPQGANPVDLISGDDSGQADIVKCLTGTGIGSVNAYVDTADSIFSSARCNSITYM